MRTHRFRFFPVAAGVILLLALAARGDPPTAINYQGRLLDDVGQPIDGSRELRFTVLDSGTTGMGSVLWGETQTVTLTAGIYNVLLGSINPVSLKLAAEVVSSSLSEITGTKPIVSQLLLPHEGWISLCNKQLGI